MRTDRLETFTDRAEEVALFDSDLLRGRDPEKPWPLLPILTFIAPGGSGKSTLIEHLIERCSVDGKPALPYARLDFTVPGTPTDLLPILMLLRDQLQLHSDEYDEHLPFPRFDLGALIAQAATKALSEITPDNVRQSLSTDKKLFDSLLAGGSTLGFLVPFIPAVLAGVKMAGQIPAVQDTVQRILSHLEDSTDWKWYRTKLRLSVMMGMDDVLLHLYELSLRGRPEREELVNEWLPAAFAADLYGALVEATIPKAWTKVANVVIFLDGFEALQSASSTTAMQLLRGLAIEPRKQGQTDPLLLVIGSRDPLPGMTEDNANR